MNDRNDSEKSRQVKQRNKALFTIPDLVHCWKRGNDMKNRAIIVLLAAIMACATFVLSSCAAETEEGRNSVDAAESAESMPRDLLIDSGDLNNRTGLNPSYKLNRSNGKYLNLYVENRGSTSVVAAINGQSESAFAPGESGHISLEVTQGFLGLDREYECTVGAGANGGAINIHYEIAQQDTQ
jgi:hypothetical protein